MIPVNEPFIGDLEKSYVNECLDSGWVSSKGKYIKEFENQFSSYCECEYGVTTTNGTSAIHLALKTLDICPGDEILVPSFTMVGSVYPIVQCGAIPVFVDCDLETYCIDIEDLKRKITRKSKAVIVVHLYGHPCDMDPIMDVARKNSLWVIEDAAEAHGALYKGRKVGGIGDIGCFSFYANKIITCGEGGMLVTNNTDFTKKSLRLKDLAHSEVRFTHDLPEAYNYRMTNLQAAIGLAQLKRIDEIIDKKIINAQHYNQLLSKFDFIKTPVTKSWAKNVYWMYAVRLVNSSSMTKEKFMDQLRSCGIDTRSFFYPLNLQVAFSKYAGDDCPNTVEVSKSGFYLPSGQTLTFKDIEAVVEQCFNTANKLTEVEVES